MQRRKVKSAFEKLDKKNKLLFRIAKFLVKFNLFALPLYAILLSGYQSAEVVELTAQFVQSLLTAFNIPFERAGLLFSIAVANGNWGAVINWDCVGWKSLLAVFALVMATDYPMKKKLRGLAVLLPAVYIANLLRIVFLIWFVSAYDIAYFAIVHAIVWSWGLIFLILASWALWMRTR